ncbi:MAG: hypothetical protein OEZ02_14420, partial [Anaerolineae bacterium]|nr:hypothetical protein [Anaerolineae bacterium]
MSDYTTYSDSFNQGPISRNEALTISRAASLVNEHKFIRRFAGAWLEAYPGDLAVEFLYAQALIGDALHQDAFPILKRLCIADPEFLDAQTILALTNDLNQYSSSMVARACIYALGSDSVNKENTPTWGIDLRQAIAAVDSGDFKNAEAKIQSVLLANPASPLAHVVHLKFAQRHYEWQAVRSLAESYNTRWPDNIAGSLILADLMMSSGEEQAAVAMLHECAAQDISGQVATRLWGVEHAYKTMWPTDLEINLEIPIPAAVSRSLGWNQLSQGLQRSVKRVAKDSSPIPNQLSTPGHVPEALRSVQAELEKVAARMRKPHFGRSDGRFPIYLILSTKQGLLQKYGSEGFAKINKSLHALAQTTQAMRNWSAAVIYADDQDSASHFGVNPARATDPWAIKNMIRDLDVSLHRRGEMIGALLIVGGPEVVPFHKLPNPVDDSDADVASDNPYATLDEDYFIPNWPVGRIPGGAGSDPQFLLQSIAKIIETRRSKREKSFFRRMLEKISQWFHFKKNPRPSFGYTAEMWQRASHSVYRPIGEPRSLAISPPTIAEKLHKRSKHPVHLGYYNLHGLEDSAEWYGQRDPLETPNGPDYPIALRPQDVLNSGRAPQIVFSEACYGAHILDKTPDSALALKFLSSGTHAVIGSTCTSYGSISTPLIAADLLGQAFWKLLKEGHTVGEALRRAKIHLAREMHRRQGYLDGEDQKTLIQFILYGDPLAAPYVNGSSPKRMLREQSGINNLVTVCDRANDCSPVNNEIPAAILSQVKGIVASYLPGMSDASLVLSQQHNETECIGHTCPSNHSKAKTNPPQ